jgi:hypothetical protein
MAQKFLTNIDLNQNQLQNFKFQVLDTDPSAYAGRMYYNSTNGVVRWYNGTAWVNAISSITTTGANTDAITVTPSANGTVTIGLNLADVDSAGLLTAAFWSDLTNATTAATINTLAKRDGSGNISVATPTADAHAATKAYVDAARSGLDVKQSVRVASVAPVAIATALEEGDIIDGVTLVAGDRVLLKDQSTASENGIYVAVASGAGAASRATDADTSAEVTTGMFTFVSEGTVNADNGFVLTTNDTITLGTTNLTFVQFSGAGQVTAGAGLTKSGNTIDAVGTASRITVNADSIDIHADYAGQSSITTLGTIGTGTWAATDVAVEHGGTNASTAAQARTNLGIETPGAAESATTSTPTLARIAKQGNTAHSSGTSTTVVKHNFSNVNVIVQIFQVSTGEVVIGDITARTADAITVVLLGEIAANIYTIVVTG